MVDYRIFLNPHGERIFYQLNLTREGSKISSTVALTNKRVISFYKAGKINKFKDIPLSHITSSEFDFSGIKWGIFILGIMLPIAGIIMFAAFIEMSSYYGPDMLSFLLLFGGIGLIIYGIVLIVKSITLHGEIRIYSYGDRPTISAKVKVKGYNNEITQFIRLLHFVQENHVIVDNMDRLAAEIRRMSLAIPAANQGYVQQSAVQTADYPQSSAPVSQSQQVSPNPINPPGNINVQEPEYEQETNSAEISGYEDSSENGSYFTTTTESPSQSASLIDKIKSDIKKEAKEATSGVFGKKKKEREAESPDFFDFSKYDDKTDDDIFVNKISCPKCGALMPANMKFCTECGSPLK